MNGESKNFKDFAAVTYPTGAIRNPAFILSLYSGLSDNNAYNGNEIFLEKLTVTVKIFHIENVF